MSGKEHAAAQEVLAVLKKIAHVRIDDFEEQKFFDAWNTRKAWRWRGHNLNGALYRTEHRWYVVFPPDLFVPFPVAIGPQPAEIQYAINCALRTIKERYAL